MRIDRIKLITEMEKAKVNVGELAARAGLCRTTVATIKSGKSCTEETAAKLAASLGVPLESLAEERGARNG